MKAAVLALLLAVTASPALADEPAAELRIGRGIRHGKVVGEIHAGHSVKEGARVFVWAKVTGLPGKTVEFVWTREDTVVTRATKKLVAGRAWASLRLPRQQRYPAGGTVWGVELRSPDGTVLADTGFSAHGPCARTHDCP